MKTITTKVYTLNELGKKARDKARAWYREGDDYPFMQEYMQKTLAELLKKAKIKCDDPKVFYSLAYCQGDGAMFEGVATWGKYTATIKQSGHYYHYNSKTIDLVHTDTGEYATDKVYEKFNDTYVEVCTRLAKAGYRFTEAEDADENVDDCIRANEYTFTADGERFG